MKWPDDIEEPKGNLPVYETEESEIEPEMLCELAQRFGLDGKVQPEKDMYIIARGRRVLVLYKETGAFWHADFAKLYNPKYKPELPSEDEAAKIATDYLKRNEWLPEGAILDGVNLSKFEMVEGKERERNMEHPNNICVEFRPCISDLKTYGPGAKIKVFTGHKGEVIGLFHAMQPVHEYAEFPALSRDDIEEILRQKLGLSLEEIRIKTVKLAYHAESCVLNKRFVQPVYVFELEVPAKSRRRREPTTIEFETHPLPATNFAPVVTIKAPSSPVRITQGERLSLSCDIRGGTPPYKVSWESNIDGHLSDERVLETSELSIAHRGRRLTSHTIKATVTDKLGMQDSHHILVTVRPHRRIPVRPGRMPEPDAPDDPYVGVEWCNIYHGFLPDISGTDASAQGFKSFVQGLPGWSSRFDWGNDAAWEQDFKHVSAPGGGTDSYWADNVHFAFFAGHGGSGRFLFGSSVDDHEMRAQDARWGDGILNWIVLHACQTMRANFEWTVWCDAFRGLHMMLGFHTNTEGSTPPLGSRFAFWMTLKLPWVTDSLFDIRTAWRIACTECFDSSREYAVIYAGQSGTDTHNDHLLGYGHVSSDPTSPYYWVYYKGTC